MRRIASFLFSWLWPAVAVAQVAGAGYVNPLSICKGYTYTYNLVTGVCTTNSPNGCSNNGQSGIQATLTSTIATGNSAATNNTALLNFAKQAQYHTRPAVTGWYNGGYSNTTAIGNSSAGDAAQATDASASNCIVAYIPSGATYQYSNNQWAFNLPWIKIYGDGGVNVTGGQTVLQNTNNDGAEVDEQALHSGIDWMATANIASANNLGYFIQSVSAGATSMTLSGSAANASNFYVGGWVIVASYDQQFSGYSPNFRYFDYGKVTSANASTGVITIDTPTVYSHVGLPSGWTSSTATNPWCPSGTCTTSNATLTDGPTGTVGPARIIPVDTPSHPTHVWFELDHIKFAANPNWSLGSNQVNDCVFATGSIDVQLLDINEVNGLCMSQMRSFTIMATEWQGDESDKDIATLTYWGDVVTYLDVSHPDQSQFNVWGSHLSNTVAQFNGNSNDALNILVQNSVFDAPLNNCNYFVSALGTAEDPGDNHSTITLNNVSFVGNNQACQTANSPVNAPPLTQGAGLFNVGTTIEPVAQVTNNPGGGTNNRLYAPIAGGGTIPGGSNVYGGLNGGINNSGAYNIASFCYPGAQFYKNNLLGATTVSNVTTDGTNVYLDFPSGTTFAANDAVECSRVQKLVATNSQGILTGYTWGAGGNFGIRYPSGVSSIPSVTSTNGHGN